MKDINAADEQVEKILVLEAAQAWRSASLQDASIEILQAHYAKLVEHKHEVPFRNKCLFTSYYAMEFQRNKRFDDWMAVVTWMFQAPARQFMCNDIDTQPAPSPQLVQAHPSDIG